MSYFSEESIEENERRNEAFQLLCGIREAVSIAKRTQQSIPYRKALELAYDISPELHKELSNLLTKANESELVKYYKQKAELVSKETGKIVFAEDLISKDLELEKKLFELGDNANLIQKRIFELEAALEYFQPEDISENFILNHDFTLPSKHPFFEKKLYDTAKVKDYQLSGNRILRLRLLHPDKAERIIGSDLVYEQFSLRTNRVRFIHLQYKTWNNKVLYLSNGNILDQIEKLDKNICKSGYCHNENGKKHSDNYRLPFCSAFLRPTNFLTKPDSTLISSGIHLPVCMVNTIREKENKITNKNVIGKSIGHRVFEDLFIDNIIGSNWITIEQLEKFYTEKGITSQTARIRVHAQEVIQDERSEAEKVKNDS